MRWREMLAPLLLAMASFTAAADAPVDAAALYATHCASCHGAQRLGGMGPALLPQSLERLRQADAQKVMATTQRVANGTGLADLLTAQQQQ